MKLNKCYLIQINLLFESKKTFQTNYFLSFNQIFFLSASIHKFGRGSNRVQTWHRTLLQRYLQYLLNRVLVWFCTSCQGRARSRYSCVGVLFSPEIDSIILLLFIPNQKFFIPTASENAR